MSESIREKNFGDVPVREKRKPGHARPTAVRIRLKALQVKLKLRTE